MSDAGESMLPLDQVAVVHSAFRDYEEALEELSVRQIVVRNGKVLSTPEFQSYKRVHSED